jgi:hypothetical protein
MNGLKNILFSARQSAKNDEWAKAYWKMEECRREAIQIMEDISEEHPWIAQGKAPARGA